MTARQDTKQKRKILVVDDVEQNRCILSEILKDEYTVVEADDGDTCLELLRSDDDIILVLLDLIMPRLDGFEVLKAISSDDGLRHKSVIATTADKSTETEVKALALGAVDFLEKPYNPEIVRSRVKNVVESIVLEIEMLEKNLNRVNEDLSATVGLLPEGAAILKILPNEKFDIEYSNENFLKLFKLNSDESDREFDIEELFGIVLDDDKFAVAAAFGEAVANHSSCTSQFRVPTSDKNSDKDRDAVRFIRMSATVHRDEGNYVRCYILFFDITEEVGRENKVKSVLDELRYVSRHDTLTQVYKRDTFCDMTEKLLRENSRKKYSIILWDIKNFKVVNELFGKEIGDKILVLIAEKLKEIVGDDGVYGRLESDKFAVCIPAAACDIHSIILDMDSMLNNTDVLDYNLKIFAGIYNIVSDDDIPVSQMCDRAGMALKRAKTDYINRFAYYDSDMRQAVLDEEEIINEMEEALATHQFKVSYQPIFSLSTGKPISAEALVRWIHPKKGIVSPIKFITVFENNKFITNLDWYVLEEVCKFQKKRMESGDPIFPISVNFSRLDCYKPMICENVLGLVEKYGLKPNMIKIEITETAYTNDKEQIITVTNKFRDLGFQVLMDDFGSGYSSLNTLKDVSIDVLKIDKKFIDDIECSEKGAAIVSSVVRMSRMLGIDVIAEGVENQYQIDLLRGVGCDAIQGYYFSKPLFEDEFSQFINSYFGEDTENACDFSSRTVDIDNIWKYNSDVNKMFEEPMSALGMYELRPNGVLEVLRVNDEYYDLFGSTPNSLYTSLGNSFENLDERSRSVLLEGCSCAKYESRIARVEINRRHQDGHMMRVLCRIKYLGQNGNRDTFFILLNDMTENSPIIESQSGFVYDDIFRNFFKSMLKINTKTHDVTVLYSDNSCLSEIDPNCGFDEFCAHCVGNIISEENSERYRSCLSSLFDANTISSDSFVDEKGNLCRLVKIDDVGDNIFVTCVADIIR